MARDYTRAEVLDIIEREAQQRNIPRDDFMRFAYIETGGQFNEQASRGPNSAKGLFQFVPATAEQYGIRGRELDAVANTDAAAQLYQDNRRILVNRHANNGMPYLSGKDQPDGMDLYMAHQQGADGYRSIQSAITHGEFTRSDTRAKIINNVSREDLKEITGVGYDAFKRLPDKEMAQTFSKYWDSKFDHIRIPEKGIEPVTDAPSRATPQPHATPAHSPAQTQAPTAAQQHGGIALSTAYALTEKYDHVKYAMNGKHAGVDGKHPEQGYVDCSGWVVTMQNATMREINQKAGHAVFGKNDEFKLGLDGAAMIVEKAQQRSGVLIQGKDVNAQNLKEGMIIGEDNGAQSWDKGRYKGIDHITMVVRDPKDGELKISQSRGGEGVELSSLDSYLERKHAKGVKLYASDPLAEARDLLQDRTHNKQHAQGANEHKPAHPQAAADTHGVLRENAQGADVQKLQHSLQQLGYKDASGNALKADSLYGHRTGEAVKAFQRAHGLQDDGVVGRDTLNALKHAEKAPLLSEKTNPDHALYNQAVGKLEQLGPAAFANRRALENAAGSLTFEAKVSGLQRIDLVVQSKDGSGLFAVQGQPSDPSHQRVYADKSAATERPLEQSSNAVRQDAQAQQQTQDQHEQQRNQSRPGP